MSKRKKQMRDERVRLQRLTVSSEALSLLLLFLLGSILVKQFVLGAPFFDYVVEFVGFLGAAVYVAVRNIWKGAGEEAGKGRGKKGMLLHSLVCGVSVAGATAVSAYFRYGKNTGLPEILVTMAACFLSATISAFLILLLLSYLGKKRMARLEQELNEEE